MLGVGVHGEPKHLHPTLYAKGTNFVNVCHVSLALLQEYIHTVVIVACSGDVAMYPWVVMVSIHMKSLFSQHSTLKAPVLNAMLILLQKSSRSGDVAVYIVQPVMFTL